MMAQEFSAQVGLGLSGASEKRRDIWTSKQEAYTIMKSRETWKKWDDRVLKIYTVSADFLATYFSMVTHLSAELWAQIVADCRIS